MELATDPFQFLSWISQLKDAMRSVRDILVWMTNVSSAEKCQETTVDWLNSGFLVKPHKNDFRSKQAQVTLWPVAR